MRNILYILFLVCSFSYGQVILDAYKFEVGCLDAGDFPTGNAASCPDVDSTSGWTSISTTTLASVSVGGRGYVLQCTATGSGSSQGTQYTITGAMDGSSTYDVYFDYRVTNAVSSTQASRAWVGFTTAPTHTFETDGVWRTKQETVVSNSTNAALKFYSTRVAASGGNVIQIDNIRVIKQ